jgi:RecA-family ATPase
MPYGYCPQDGFSMTTRSARAPATTTHTPPRSPPAKRTHWARDYEARDVSFVLNGYLARGVVSSIYAPRDAGKTTVAIHLMAALSRGRMFGARHPKRRSLLNTQEDQLETVIKPRLMASGADLGEKTDPHPWVAIAAEPWTFPDDLDKLKAKLRDAEDGGAPFDLVVLDSVSSHIVRLNSIEPTTRAMDGLIGIAQEYDLAILLIGHLTKSKGSTVESAIYGAGVLQNLSKGLFVYGPLPPPAEEEEEEGEEDAGRETETGLPQFALACERTGWGPKPPTVVFEQQIIDVAGLKAPQVRLDYLGISDLTAWQVKEFSKLATKGSAADKGKTEKAADWIIAHLAEKKADSWDSGLARQDVIERAKTDGVYSSVNTWERAQSRAKTHGLRSERRGNTWRWFLGEMEVPDE